MVYELQKDQGLKGSGFCFLGVANPSLGALKQDTIGRHEPTAYARRVRNPELWFGNSSKRDFVY